MKHRSNTAPELLMTISESAAMLRVSEKTVRRWIKAKDLPAAKLGAQWRFRSRDLQDFIAGRLIR